MLAESKATSSLLGDSKLVTSDLDGDSESEGIIDGLLGIIKGRIEDDEKSNELEAVCVFFMIIAIEFP